MKWWKSNWILFLYSAISALAVTMDLNVADAPEAGITIGLYQRIYRQKREGYSQKDRFCGIS